MDSVSSHFGKMQLWPLCTVEHFLSQKSEAKVFNWSELHFTEVTSYKIHTLVGAATLPTGTGEFTNSFDLREKANYFVRNCFSIFFKWNEMIIYQDFSTLLYFMHFFHMNQLATNSHLYSSNFCPLHYWYQYRSCLHLIISDGP